ncbi:hypothetical protein HHK36_008692 [Tetracentron sinense]|uniref:DUF632 domain-containing protein n=1 Tax=Tetracentron sinense TaxID=13715 RepID=A0A835DK79_TETSI|nr:hypothetical protein HHK36_008692 [Tetracentron sinense]
MGCCYSRVEREEMVTRCRARKRYMKHLVKARQAFSVAHSLYLMSLRSTGSSLLQFANSETNLHHHHLLPSPLPTPPVPISRSSENWTSVTASPAFPPPSPPPPPPSSWDFWDPFAPSASRFVTEEEWEATTPASEVPVTAVRASLAATPSVVRGYSKETTNELSMVVSRNSKDLVDIFKEIDEYFVKAADSGDHVSLLLEVSSSGFSNQKTSGKVYNCGRSFSPLLWTWSSNSKSRGFGRLGEEMVTSDVASGTVFNTSHCSTVERLFDWEKKLYQDVKNAENIKLEHEKRVAQLGKQEIKGADHVKIEKGKKEIENLESRMVVASQAIETTSAEINKVRETELYPQLLELVKGLMCMWRCMYECHQVQTHLVQQLKFLNSIPATDPTSEIHQQSTLQLELEVQQWHLAFSNFVKTQQDYIRSLTGWLRLSLFQFNNDPLAKTKHNSTIYSLCEEWQLAFDRIPDTVASEGIQGFLTVIHAIVVQQAEEQKQKKKSEAAFKELEEKEVELQSLECKYGPFSMPGNSLSTGQQGPDAEKQAKVEILKAKAEEEKTKHEKSVGLTRAMTVNNLQMGFPHVFQAMTGFSSACMHAFESLCNQPKSTNQGHDLKRILT